ncbi:MAG: glycogen/starch synthase [Flavobacteriales bacterium]|nr:glycogen/starch synthase [Flavobacteriales bacterium]
MEKSRVLYITHEMVPYMQSETDLAKASRELPQGMQEKGWEIRNFMPRFGCINERRHQLHEVIRLSGMNIIVNDTDQPLIIKVASIPTGRIQVYFIDNEEFFQRKHVLTDENDTFFADNDERSIFFCKGVLETVKKLGWSPDVVHCHGWMSALVPYYLKTVFKNDPVFSGAKIVFSMYEDDRFGGKLHKDYVAKASEGITGNSLTSVGNSPTFSSVLKGGIEYADAVITTGNFKDKEVLKFIKDSGKPMMETSLGENYVDDFYNFYNEILQESAIPAE